AHRDGSAVGAWRVRRARVGPARSGGADRLGIGRQGAGRLEHRPAPALRKPSRRADRTLSVRAPLADVAVLAAAASARVSSLLEATMRIGQVVRRLGHPSGRSARAATGAVCADTWTPPGPTGAMHVPTLTPRDEAIFLLHATAEV